MSTSEITAYLLGVEIRGQATAGGAGRVVMDRPLSESMTPEELAAWVRLGETAFRYWLLRGANEAQAWQD